MSAKTLIIAAVLVALGLASRSRAGESEAPPPPKGQVFDAMDRNHDGVIQREEFEQFHRQRDGTFQRDRGQRPRDRFGGEGQFEKRIDEAVDRALEKAGGDPQQLRQILREELMRSMGKGRGFRGETNDPPPRGPDGVENENSPRDGSPPAGPRGFGDRRGPDDDQEYRRSRRGGGPGGGDGKGFQRKGPEQRAARVMERLDANGDGSLSADELGERGSRLMKADANGDGRVDQTELMELFLKMMPEGRQHSKGGSKGPDVPPPPVTEE